LYYENSPTGGDRGKSLEAYRNAYLADSTSTIATNQISIQYLLRHQWDSAARYMQRQLRLQPNSASFAKLALTQAYAGHLDSAGTLLDSLMRAAPTTPPSLNLLSARFALFAARGQVDSALRLAEQLGGSSDFGIRSASYLVTVNRAMELGKFRTAI